MPRFQKVYLLKAEFLSFFYLHRTFLWKNKACFDEKSRIIRVRQKVYFLTVFALRFCAFRRAEAPVWAENFGKEGAYLFRLCVCDDQPVALECVRVLAEQFDREHPELALRMQTFDSPYDLLDALETQGGFDMYLLDIIMPHMTGMELARLVRKRGESAAIVFLTSSREYALDAFSVGAAGYLLKPVEKDDFDSAVLSAIRAAAPAGSPSLLLKTRDGLRRILLRELMLVESQNHKRICTLADGTALETSDTLASLLGRLNGDARFFSPHRAYIVNLDYISSLSTAELLLSDGRRVPVSRKLSAALREAYTKYVF